MRLGAAALCASVGLACGAPPTTSVGADDARCNPREIERACARTPGSTECVLHELRSSGGRFGVMAALLSDAGETPDSVLRALFPALEGKTIVDTPLERPPGLVFDLSGFEPYAVPTPIDWSADPFSNNSWQLYFQTFHWLPTGPSASDEELDAALFVVVDWAENALFLETPLDFTWYDAGIGRRLDRVAALVATYLDRRPVVSRRVMVAAARIVLTHLYALHSDECFNDTNNHGVMQAVSILSNVRRYPSLRDGARFLSRAERRLIEHVDAAVLADGSQVENSPSYHILFLDLVASAIDAYRVSGATPPIELTLARDRLVSGITHLLQPDLTVAQFGDSENGDVAARLRASIDAARDQLGGTTPALDELEWVVTRGERGRIPPMLDRVYATGGYAAFRTDWSADAISGHFTCGRLSASHYHRDETSFEIHGHGETLLVDAGKYSYDARDPRVQYQYDVHAHNVMTIDERSYEPSGTPAIIGFEIADELSWVQGSHDNYADLGIERQVRTFAHLKPNVFVIIDHVRAGSEHAYTQHFHLAPRLSRLQQRDGSVIATSPDGTGPAVVLTPLGPDATRAVRGLERDDGFVQGLYFPTWRVADAATNVSFHYEREGGELSFVTLVTITPPDEEPRLPSRLALETEDGSIAVSWLDASGRQRVAVPSPFRRESPRRHDPLSRWSPDASFEELSGR